MASEAVRAAKGKRTKSTKKKVAINNRMQMFLDGELSISDLDFEELQRGQIRNENGTFGGRPTDMIPRKFYNAAIVEFQKRSEDKFREELGPAIDTLKAIHKNPKAPADARMKSAIFLIERAAGKTPERSDVRVEVKKWEESIDSILVDTPAGE